jgi:hypothetical protein
MSSFRRRLSAQKNKRKNGRRDKNEFETRHIEHRVQRLMLKEKFDKYKDYDKEDI